MNTYYLLCAVETCNGLRFEVLDMQDATIDLLTKSELSQAESMGLDIRKVHSEYLPDAYHVAVPIWETDLGVLFRVQGTKITARLFDKKDFYSPVNPDSEIVFYVKRDEKTIPRVRAYAYYYDSKVYFSIKNQAFTRKTLPRRRKVVKVLSQQSCLYSISESNRTYSEVFNTGWSLPTEGKEENCMINEKWVHYMKDIKKNVKVLGGHSGFSPYVREIDKWYY